MQKAVLLRQKIFLSYIILVAVIVNMAAILVHERDRIREIETESAEIHHIRRGINNVHRHITELVT